MHLNAVNRRRGERALPGPGATGGDFRFPAAGRIPRERSPTPAFEEWGPKVRLGKCDRPGGHEGKTRERAWRKRE